MRQSEHAPADAEEAGVLSLREVDVAYGRRRVLAGVFLDVRRQDIIALIGLNGAGKSTILRLIAGFHPAAGGSVRFMGRDVTHLSTHERAALGMGYFMQGGSVFPSLTVEENIELAAAPLPKLQSEENVQAVLSLFPHLIGLSRTRGAMLSGGDRQSLALALALVRRPKLLLLDEPLAGLAPTLVLDVVAKLREVVERWGVSILLVEQNIREAINISNRVVAITNNRAVELEGEPPETLLTNRRLQEIFFGRALC